MILGYIDPGAGSMLIQAIIAALISLPFFFRTKLRAAVARLRGQRTDRNDTPGRPSERE